MRVCLLVMETARNILVLGVGNILYTDEGVGVRTVEAMEERYAFSDNVELMDGGTLGMRLMDALMSTDMLIVVDAVLGDGEPGDIYRLTGDDLRKSISFKNSLHQTDLVDTLVYCEILGNRPDAVVVGMEPEDYQSMGLAVSPALAKRRDEFIAKVLDEIAAAGGSWTEK